MYDMDKQKWFLDKLRLFVLETEFDKLLLQLQRLILSQTISIIFFMTPIIQSTVLSKSKNSFFFINIDNTTEEKIMYHFRCTQKKHERCPCGVVVNELDWDIAVSEFEILSRYDVHFQTNTIGKDMNPLINATID